MSRADRIDLAAAVLSGLLLAAAFPPFDLGAIATVALLPLLYAVSTADPGRAARLGFLTGAVFHLLLLHWLVTVMTRYGGLPLPAGVAILLLLVGYLAIYVAGFAWLVARAIRRWGPPAVLLAPIAWVGLEFLRGRILTGFPWGTLGYTQYRDLPLLQAAAAGGVHLLSLLVAGVAAGLALLLDRRARAATRLAGLVPLLLFGAAHLAGAQHMPPAGEPGPEGIEVAAIQANVPQDRKWRRSEADAIVDRILAMSDAAAASGARLLVWPESSSPESFRRPVETVQPDGSIDRVVAERRDYLDRVATLTRTRGISVIAGSVDYAWHEGEWRATNSAFVIGPDGRLGPSYAKIHLVPFGEYVPLQEVLFFVDAMVQGAIAGFMPGDSLRPLPTEAGAAGTSICYEAIFPGLMRSVARDADFLVNLTNDAWFGRSGAPRQHLAMAVVRAVENRRWMVRAANTGISAVIDPAGRIRAEAALDTQQIVRARIAPLRARPPFARHGDVAGIACAILTAFLLTAALRAAFFLRRAR